MRTVILNILLCLLLHVAVAQDISGIWKGSLVQEEGGCFPEYNVELQINFIASANTLLGKAYDYHTTNEYIKLDFSGRYNPNNKKVLITESDLLESSIPAICTPCIKNYDLTYNKTPTEETLIGICHGREYGSENSCPAYSITLKRTAVSAFAPVIKKNNDALFTPPAPTEKREKEIAYTLQLDTPALTLYLYDNGEIDNDTVTLLLNNKPLLYKQMLTTQPHTIQLNAVAGTDYELALYADNMGSIPPNTALMVITAGKKRYELRLASSTQKTAVVKFRYNGVSASN
jgi:hypothetical protein